MSCIYELLINRKYYVTDLKMSALRQLDHFAYEFTDTEQVAIYVDEVFSCQMDLFVVYFEVLYRVIVTFLLYQ